ncbi:hypothetical protein EFQ99_31595 [Rhizobium vallis]|uniref:Uncharacterized protein n=1 Tax=Rhizobium vallis TaxID=634290 RepID=A0A3S0SLP6_9HYPH|nr:hypothetical protein [Rhizobium vallis]RUM19310.1 hypothetical protein EFQ99_31595 [Rhizobium vallis]
MVTVTANERGYFDGELRDIGASFVVPDALWNDEERRPRWASLSREGVGAARIVRPKVGEADGVAEIPEDWQSLSVAARKALARAISGEPVPNVKDADGAIAAEIARRAVDAGSGVGDKVSGNGIQEALGQQQPDWVVPAAS